VQLAEDVAAIHRQASGGAANIGARKVSYAEYERVREQDELGPGDLDRATAAEEARIMGVIWPPPDGSGPRSAYPEFWTTLVPFLDYGPSREAGRRTATDLLAGCWQVDTPRSRYWRVQGASPTAFCLRLAPGSV
jgi:hypothetical protein